MQTNLAERYADTADGREAEDILRKCVHCGFCTATCPTYQLLGDELDGPRGRIYQIKEVLEGATPTASMQTHLDRCLTCRSCETTLMTVAPWSARVRPTTGEAITCEKSTTITSDRGLDARAGATRAKQKVEMKTTHRLPPLACQHRQGGLHCAPRRERWWRQEGWWRTRASAW